MNDQGRYSFTSIEMHSALVKPFITFCLSSDTFILYILLLCLNTDVSIDSALVIILSAIVHFPPFSRGCTPLYMLFFRDTANRFLIYYRSDENGKFCQSYKHTDNYTAHAFDLRQWSSSYR